MGKSRYLISFGGLPVGIHEFEFDVSGTFFQEMKCEEISKADLQVKLMLTKQNNTLQADFVIEGTVGIDCDRCLKAFDLPLHAEEKLVIKYGDPAESNDEILVIREGETEFEVSHYIYEYVLLALPARKVPCEIDAERFTCDEETLQRLEAMSTETEEQETHNPMWEQLKKLKNKN